MLHEILIRPQYKSILCEIEPHMCGNRTLTDNARLGTRYLRLIKENPEIAFPCIGES